MDQIQTISESRKYNNLDGLRSLAAVTVICAHMMVNIGFQVPAAGILDGILHIIIDRAMYFIHLFFIISGFSLCCGYYQRFKTGSIDLNTFYNKRYLRILPFFSLLTLLDVAAEAVLGGGLTPGSLWEAFSNVTLMFGLFTTQGMNIIGVGWTLGIIFGFYLLFPFFVYLIWTKRRAWFSLLIAVGIYLASNVYFDTGSGSLTMPWMCFFLVGGILYLYREKLEARVSRPWVWISALVLGIAITFFPGIPLSGNLPEISAYLALSVTGLSLVTISALSPDNVLWCNPVSRFISSVSMEVYLSHMMIFRVMEKAGLLRLAGESALSYWIACFLNTAGTLIFAWVYKQAEKWVLRRLASR